MNRHQLIQRGLVMIAVLALISGCAGALPSPGLTELPPAAPLQPPIQPQAVPQAAVPQANVIPKTGSSGPYPANPTATPAGTGTVTVTVTPTLAAPLNRPFLMKIDHISAVTGLGLLLQGRVANGTLRAGNTVEVLGVQSTAVPLTVQSVLIGNTPRNEVTVGDYAGVLVGGL
jgi:hypothetical protein